VLVVEKLCPKLRWSWPYHVTPRSPPLSSLRPTMRSRGPLSEDLRWTLVNMHKHLGISDIVKYTGQSRRTVERILSIYRKKGCVMNSPQKKRGRKPILDQGDQDVSPLFSLFHVLIGYLLQYSSWKVCLKRQTTRTLMSCKRPSVNAVGLMWL